MNKEKGTITESISSLETEVRAGPQKPETLNAVITSLLHLFLHTDSRKEFLDRALDIVLKLAGIECGGIRVANETGNIPYIAHSGFDDQFIKSEKWLSTCTHQCACIRVILGKSESQDAAAMTPAGSFYSSNTLEFIDSLNEAEKSRFRGVCIQNGYRTLAIVPLRYGEKILGAIHLVDKRENAFSRDILTFIESSIAPLIGEGIYRFNVESQLQYNLETQTALTSLLRYSLEDLTLDDILNLSLDLIHATRAFSFGSKSLVYLLENEPDVMVLKVARGFSGSNHEECRRIPLGKCVCGKAAMKKECIFSNGDDQLHEIKPGSNERYSHYCVPIQSGKTLMGLITLYLEEDHQRNHREEQFLTVLASTLAGIILRKQSEEKLKTLSRRLVSIQEEERRAIALELHDQIGQLLTGLKLMIVQSAHSGSVKTNTSPDEAQTIVNDLIVRVREMSLNLRPSMLDDLGLLPTLLWHFQKCNAQARLNISFRHSGLERHFPKDVNIAAYRIVQEALTNIVRYAGVSDVSIDAWVDEGVLHLRIEDKGKGFRAAQSALNMTVGLQGMRERAALLGGNLNIESAPGKGTRITADLPLQDS
jgi:signal transduction histidine kinase